MKRANLLLIVTCLILVLIVSSIPFTTGCSTSPAETKTLKIGVLVSMTGPAAVGCITLKEGVELAADWVNDNGGIKINGDTYLIEIIAEDDMSSPPGALSGVNKLVHEDGVKFIVPPIIVPCNIAIGQVAEEAKVIRMKVTIPGGPYEVNPDNPYHFAAYSIEYNAPCAYDYLQESYPQVKRLAMVYNDDEGGRAVMEADVREAQARGLEVVFNESYPMGTEDFYPIMTKALEKNPDAIDLISGLPMWYAGIIKQARELGFTGPMFCPSPSGGDLPGVVHLVGAEFAYDIFFADFDPNNAEGLPPMIDEIGERVKQETNSTFAIAQIDGWAALWALVQGIEKAQSLDTDKVRTTLQGMQSIETPYGEGRMGGQERYGINNVIIRPAPLSRFVDGQIKFVKFTHPGD